MFNGFTFYQVGNSIQDMQNRMFTAFLIVTIPPTAVNAVVPKFYQNMALWQAREHPSRIYGWFAFSTAMVVGELPISIVCSVIYWLVWYYPSGLPTDTSTAGYVFLMTLLFFFFMNSWGQWICAFAPSFTVISNVLPFFFVMVSLEMPLSPPRFPEELTKIFSSLCSTVSSALTPIFRSFGDTGCIMVSLRCQVPPLHSFKR